MAAATRAPDTAGIPQELTQRAQWVTWCYVERKGKRTKEPHNPRTGGGAMANVPETWETYDAARKALSRTEPHYDGIGYEVHASDPYTSIDLDGCRNPETGEIAEWGIVEVRRFNSYTEVSPSGKGLHIWIKGCIGDAFRKGGQEGRNVHPYEAYSGGHFLTMTGDHLEGTPATIEERQDALDAFCAEHFAPKQKTAPKTARPQDAHSGGFLDLDDSDILATALNDAKFAALWYGDAGGYPSASEAVFALLRKLEFYTWGDADRMDRFFRQSGLMSDKWDTRRGNSTLGDFNIQKILSEPGDHASYLHLLKSNTTAGADEVSDTPETEPESVQILRARIVDLEAMVAARDATIAQLTNELAGSRDANVRLNREIVSLKEYKRSRDEAEEIRQVINALPSERLSVTDKLVLHCGIRHIRSAQSRGAVREDGGVQFPLGAPADEIDISTDTASKSVHRLGSLGYWTCDTTSEYVEKVDPKTGKTIGQWVKRLFLIPNEEYISQPLRAIEAAEEVQAPERNHGGKRIRCEMCNSDDVMAQTVYVCRSCNHEWRSEPRDANRPMQEEETSADATSPENFRYPQDAAFEQPITILPQVAGIGQNRLSRPTPASTDQNATPSLCLHERDQHASVGNFRMPQDAGIAPRHVSSARSTQEYALYAWAKAHGWAKLPYVGGAPFGGDAETWGQDIRKASDKQIALAYATISTQVAAS